MIEITFVGTGSAFGRLFGQTNVMITSGATRLMIDFGAQTPERLMQMDIELKDISHILVTHLHADHIGGLEQMAFVSKFADKRTPHLLLPGNLATLVWENSLRGGLEWNVDELGRSTQCQLESYFQVDALKINDWFRIDDLGILPFPVLHVGHMPCFGIIIKDFKTNHQAIFTSDVRDCLPDLMQDPLPVHFSTGPIFHDCQLWDEGPGRVHAPLSRLYQYPHSIKERLFLVHYGDNISDYRAELETHKLRIMQPQVPFVLSDWQDNNHV